MVRAYGLNQRLHAHYFHRVTLPRYLRSMGAGDVVIDAGAHVGRFTTMFAATGARVYAFEPHPAAFAELLRASQAFPNIICVNKALAARAGTAPLYFPAAGAGLEGSQSASLMISKDNIRPESFTLVETVRLVDLIAELGHVRFLKMDIEGAEYEVLPDLIDSGAWRAIDRIAVETHQRSPRLMDSHRALIAQIRQHRLRNIDLTWP